MNSPATATAGSRPLETGWLADTPIHDTLLRRFLHNQADVDATIAITAGGRSDRDEDVALADTAGPVGLFNQATLLRPIDGGADPVLDRIEAFYATEPGRSASLLSAWPTPDLRPRGWRLVGHPTFVARGPQAPSPDALPPGVTIEVVRSPGQVEITETVLVEGFPLDTGSTTAPGAALPHGLANTGYLRLRLGSLDGTVCAMGGSAPGYGVVNLFIAATLPAARRRGVWRALVDARVSDAPDLPTVAFTSEDSRPGFERMGFLPITRFTLWERTG